MTWITMMVWSHTQSQTSWIVKLVDLRKHYYKASEDDGITAELFQILKVKVLSMSGIWKTQQWSQDWKRSVFMPIPKKGNAKVCSNYCIIVLISHVNKVMLEMLLSQLEKFQMSKLDLEKAEEPEIRLPTSVGSQRKQENSRKTPTSALLTMPKSLTV